MTAGKTAKLDTHIEVGMTRNSKIKVPEQVNNVGRPSKFTPERCAAIIHDISRRIPNQLAAEANGICEATLYDWLNTAKAHQMSGIESDYTKFSELLKRTELTKVQQHLDILSERPERWQADAWILERRWAKFFGNNVLLKELNERMNAIEGGKHVNNCNEEECGDQEDDGSSSY